MTAIEHLKSVRRKSLELIQKLNESEMTEAELASFTNVVDLIAEIDELAGGIIKDLEMEAENGK